MKNRERIYAERRSNVREVCSHYDNGRRWMNDTQGDKFYFDLQNGLAVCTIPKVRNIVANNVESVSVYAPKSLE